jgi:pimeloyl-ACP methyl ester carboxylesterase
MTVPLTLRSGQTTLNGDLAVPADATGVVVFAHGSGSSRHSPRNQAVARSLQDRGLATLLFDLLDEAEERADQRWMAYRFDLELLTPRLVDAIDQVRSHAATSGLPVGAFGASTGAAVALLAAARSPHLVDAVVSRGGRPDMAAGELRLVSAPTLLIVGERDEQGLALNQQAAEQLPTVELRTVAGATHLFEEPGALERVTELAGDWFTQRL